MTISRRSGFTLCELVVALSIVAVLASVALPNLASSRIAANEAAAIATLRQIAAAETQFQASGKCDVDQDGIGEFGLLREMSGAQNIRASSDANYGVVRLSTPLLPADLGELRTAGDALNSGYLFHVFLPGTAGIGVAETPSGSLETPVDVDLTETTWCCYAWPVRYGVTGRRTFFVNQAGDVIGSDSARYSGPGDLEWFDAGSAFRAGGRLMNITGTVATGTVGRDSTVWRPVTVRSDVRLQTVRGTLAATTHAAAAATFSIESDRLLTEFREALTLRASHLRAGPYRVVLTDSSSTITADFGGVTADARGRAAFRFDTRWWSYPDGVTDLTSFGGGSIQLRSGADVVLHGVIPAFTTPDGPNVAGSTASLHHVAELWSLWAGAPMSGSADLRVTNTPSGTRTQLRVGVSHLPAAERPFTVFVMDMHGVQATLGTLTARGTLLLDSKRGDLMPEGGLPDLADATIEVRNKFGAAVATSRFPTVE